MDPDNKTEYKQDIAQEYGEMRAEYLADQKSKSFFTLEKARQRRLKTDWNATEIKKPSFLGVKVFEEYDMNKLLDFIDWDPFF